MLKRLQNLCILVSQLIQVHYDETNTTNVRVFLGLELYISTGKLNDAIYKCRNFSEICLNSGPKSNPFFAHAKKKTQLKLAGINT